MNERLFVCTVGIVLRRNGAGMFRRPRVFARGVCVRGCKDIRAKSGGHERVWREHTNEYDNNVTRSSAVNPCCIYTFTKPFVILKFVTTIIVSPIFQPTIIYKSIKCSENRDFGSALRHVRCSPKTLVCPRLLSHPLTTSFFWPLSGSKGWFIHA